MNVAKTGGPVEGSRGSRGEGGRESRSASAITISYSWKKRGKIRLWSLRLEGGRGEVCQFADL